MIKRLIFFVMALTIVWNVSGQHSNPFDIERLQDTFSVQETDLVVNEYEEDIKLEGENPFAISHIPIRKNQIQKVKRVSRDSDATRENISITYLPFWVIAGSLCLLAFILFQEKKSYRHVI